MSKEYFLKNIETHDIIAKFEFRDTPFTGSCYQAIAWDSSGLPIEWMFHSEIYAKIDACTHWYFRGQDYINECEIDSYYHLCGNGSFEDHIRLMCFVWKLEMDLYLKKNASDKNACDYIKADYDTGLLEVMLKGYEIIEKA